MRIKNRKKGFSLPELVVALIILAIILAIGIPTAFYYIRRAEFRKNEENAKTIYMASESVLTWYRSSGQWEEFKEKVLDEGIENTSFTDERQGRIYAVTLAPGAYNTEEGKSSPVLDLVDDLTYAKDMLTSGAVAVEIDVASGHVYSAFYGTRCSGLGYDTGDAGNILDMNDRAYDSRKERFLGYYSVDDMTNVVDLAPVRLKVSSISLVNSETLYLNWSSNSRHDNMDLKFHVAFCEKSTDKELFRVTVDMAEAVKKGWRRSASDAASITQLPLIVNDEEIEGWNFQLTYQDGAFSLVLDGMMSADVLAALEKTGISDADSLALHKSSDMSITRLALIGKIKETSGVVLSEPQNIYAKVQAEATYNNTEGDTSEYRQSSVVTSNTANTMYADDTKVEDGTLKAGISAFRHLSNIRYYDKEKNAEFTLESRELDWNSAGTGLYAYAVNGDTDSAAGNSAAENTAETGNAESGGSSGEAGGADGLGILKVKWTANDGKLEFPSVPELAAKHALKGRTANVKISNLRLGMDSVPDDTITQQLGMTATKYAGLFGTAEGSISDVIFQNPSMVMADLSGDTVKEAPDFKSLQGVGIVAGKSTGDLTNIKITTDDPDKQILTVSLSDDRSGSGKTEKMAGAGGIAGVIAPAEHTSISRLSVSGTVTVKLPKPEAGVSGASAKGAAASETAEEKAAGYRYGAGGLFGYADLQSKAKISQCENHADVSSNLFAGGIVGHIDGSFDASVLDRMGGSLTGDKAEFEAASNLTDCENDGLILCTNGHKDSEDQIEGRYFGGITGYASRVLVYEASSASGRASGFTYNKDKINLLQGQYVGGIMGFGADCLLLECRTENKGYILGSDYVGGIVGGLTQKNGKISRIGGGIGVTTNAGYVIGRTYVGGIIGKNDGNNKIENCVNNGVAAGYEAYIGGIVGYNGDNAMVSNCVSYISDHSGEIFRQIVETWAATGSYAGGIAGYNSGTITFKSENNMITVRSVSGIVIGQDYVGGVVGFNDTNGDLDVAYILIGGRIYAYGDCAGGYIGLNASTKILDDDIEIRPTSVRGTYCVGGCIGANVVDLKTEDGVNNETVMGGFRTNNTLGTLTAKAFAGGVIGYQRTYTAEQLGLEPEESILSYIKAHESSNGEQADGTKAGKGGLLPELDAHNLPTEVVASENTNVFVLTDNKNTKDSLGASVNNLTIRAQMYVGGVLGYCESSSSLVVRNCKNAGRVSRPGDTEFETNADGVSVAGYLAYSGCPAEDVDESIKTDMAGGITGANLAGQVIDHCANTGSLTGFTCLGGVAGFNGGGIFNCELAGNFGNASQDYVGGIAGLNIETSANGHTYKDVKGDEQNYVPGTIAACRVNEGVTVTGQNTVGGIAAYNLPGGVIKNSVCLGSMMAYGDCAGGIAGRNGGKVLVTEDRGTTKKRTISGRNGQNVGGLVGWNENTGSIQVSGSSGAADTDQGVTAISESVTVIGGQNVGGLIGKNDGSFGGNKTLVCRAATVRALSGYAGGIAGITSGNIRNAENASAQVTADKGPAGGIVADIVTDDPGSVLIAYCKNTGNVISNDGYAGGIVPENRGSIYACTVEGTQNRRVTIRSRKTAQDDGINAVGAICAKNHPGAVITDSAPGGWVTLDGDVWRYGGIAGVNQGTIQGLSADIKLNLTAMPEINANGVTGLYVGGVAGRNESQINNIIASESFENFSNYRYLGGVAGENTVGAEITGSSYSGSMTEGTSAAAGNCYGGIAGMNAGLVKGCSVRNLTMAIKGVYTATATSTAAEKEMKASHAGGIAGMNEAEGMISNCYLDASGGSIIVDSGMAGGIAGYNKGMISRCGDAGIVGKMSGYTGSESIDDLCGSMGNIARTGYVNWTNDTDIENLTYHNGSSSVSEGKFRMIMATKGSLGGITACNALTGTLEYCATGDWFLNNKSEDISVGTGGVIGMNETEKDMKYLVNQAFVGRQLKSNNTNRFAGGIIGNQSNATTEGWTLSHCVNYGMVYGYKSHYCGGIIGQWTGSGGNIEECRNYGSLQTTFATDWVGASAGIVAQLYHAYDGNTYNIISCGNFGSIYGKLGKSYNEKIDGKNKAAAANDSAGILGNVTTYNRSADQAQSFMIQVLDCVNGPGVEIYSGSMASGIVGFFSTDNPTNSSVKAATGNIRLRIERCRNFAAKMEGANYATGIFGDRYGKEGAQKTVIQDCYSVNLYKTNDVKGGKGWQDAPVISVCSGDSEWTSIEGKKNFFFDASSYQISFSLAEGRDSEVQSEGTINQNAYATGDFLKRAGGDRAYIMYNKKQNRYFAACLTDEGKALDNIAGGNCYIKPDDGCVYKQNDEDNDKNKDIKIARILFELPQGAVRYTDTSQLAASGDVFYTYVREGWRVQEGAVTGDDGKKKLTAPKAVAAAVKNGRIQVDITPATNPDSRAEEGSLCDPFRYAVEIYVGGELAATEYLYTESGSVSIPEGFGGAVAVKVRAVSMYEDVKPSEAADANEMTGTILLPEPDIRMELVWDSSIRDYRYEISLNNLEDYNELAGDNWKVTVKTLAGTEILSKSRPVAGVTGDANTQSITAQAEPEGNKKYIESAQISVPAFMPATYRPDASLNQWEPAVPKVEVNGTTLEDLSVTVSLTHQSNKTLNTPPVYRAELVGTWKAGTSEEKKDVVFASQDILVAAQATASVSFANLPEYIREASDLKVRIWYAQSGLGPVYTYHGLDTEEGANHIQMTGLDEEGRPVYDYMYVETLEKRIKGSDNNHDYLERYRYLSGNLWTWLPAPVPAGVADGSTGELTPQYAADGSLQYTLCWDAGSAFDKDARYEFSLTGKDSSGKSVLIDTSSVQPAEGDYNGEKAWALTVTAEDWNFSEVHLDITRIGDEAKHEIGLGSEASYKVRQRLTRPEQPVIDIVSVDELDYTVTWPALEQEKGCGAYQLYAQVWDEIKDDYGEPFMPGDAVSADGSPVYSQTINLENCAGENYAGKQMRFYLVAKAAADSVDYVDSAAGITSDLIVPERIAAPTVTWRPSWRYDRTKPLSVSGFAAGAGEDSLTVNLTADNAASIPPGGSAYLMRAYVYETQEAAQAAIAAAAASDGSLGLTGYLTGYVAVEDVIKPAEMEKAGTDKDYQHTMEGLTAAYAGKWVVFQARISSGNGNVSSRWVTADPVRLPYVKLDMPEVQSDRIWNLLTAEVSENPDLPLTPARWSAQQTVFYWRSGAYADVSYVDITEPVAGGTEIVHQYRILETETAEGRAVEIYEWGPDGKGTPCWNRVTRFVPEQGTMTDAEYETLKKQQFIYPLTGYVQYIENGDGTVTEQIAGGCQKTVEGSYLNEVTSAYVAYKVSTSACLQADIQADGSFAYSLMLPDTMAVQDADGYILPDSAWKYSSKIAFRADVSENEAAEEINKSPAYVGSEENLVELY